MHHLSTPSTNRFSLLLSLTVLLVLLAGCDSGTSGNSQPVDSSAVTTSIRGAIQYEDWEYDAAGFTGVATLKPVRYAAVDLVDAAGTTLATTTTDASGNYQISGSGDGLYVRVLAQTAQGHGAAVSINNLTGSLYAATKAIDSGNQSDNTQGAGTVTVDLTITDSTGVGGPFNMLDLLTSAAQYIGELSDITLPPLAVYWQKGTNTYGTYYCFNTFTSSQCPRGSGIYVSGGIGNSGDTDHYDDDVLWHEFSHYLEDTLNILDSPGGPHKLTDNDLDLRLAWSEGWGNFFPTAIKTWLNTTQPQRLSNTPETVLSRYVDTVGNISNSDVAISIDLANPGTCGSEDCFLYSSNEVAVAKILYLLNDSYGMQSLWTVYQEYLTGLSDGFVNMESYWDGFLTQTQPDAGQLAILQSIYSERQIYYQQDSFEAMSDAVPNPLREISVCMMSPCVGEVHYFYLTDGSDDTDIVAFAAKHGKTYRVETFGLKNGADTYLSILDDSGNVVTGGGGSPLENDDRNNDCGLCVNDSLSFSSLIQFTPRSAGTYYIKVITTAEAADGAGRYGTYSLKVTEL
jgi:hypothetical protein